MVKSMRFLKALLFLAVSGFCWQAEASTTIPGPVCDLDTTGWASAQICSTIWYNDVIEDGRVVVCGYDHSVGDEELLTMYLGRNSGSGECGATYNTYNPGFEIDMTGSDPGNTSVVFDGGPSGAWCDCSCPMPNDLVADVGGNTNDWAEVSYYNFVPATGAALPGLTLADIPQAVTVRGINQGSANHVWSALGNLPQLNFVGGTGGDVWVTSWPVQTIGSPGSSTAPSYSNFLSGGAEDTVFVVEIVPATTELDFNGNWLEADFGSGNDIFYAATYAGFVSGYNPDNTHNPFMGGPTPAASTMGADTDRAMSSGSFILSDELSGTCGTYSACVTAVAVCPTWIEHNPNDPGNPAYRFPGYQLQGDGQ